MKIKIQYNQRQDPQLLPLSRTFLPSVERITNIAVPFISLHQTGSKVVSIGLGSIQVLQGMGELYQGYQRGERQLAFVGLWKVTYATAAVALIVLLPVIHVAISQGIFLVRKIHDLYLHGRQFELKHCLSDLLEVAGSFAFVASIIYGLPQYVALSLILQGMIELSTSFHEYNQGRYLEAFSNLLLAGVRGYGSKDPLMTLKRNYFGKKIDQKSWEQMVFELDAKGSKKEKNLDKWLKDHNFSSRIEKINASEQRLISMELNDVQFKDVNFGSTLFNESSLRNVTFEKCNLNDTSWKKAELFNTKFLHSSLENGNFYRANLHKVHFFASSLLRTNFVSSQLNETKFEALKLLEVSFLDADIKKSSMKHVDLTDTLLCDNRHSFRFIECTENKMTRPVIAMGWFFEDPLRYAKMTKKVVDDQKGIVLLYDNEQRVDGEKLRKEVNERILSLREDAQSSEGSIPQKIFQKNYSQETSLGALKIYAKKVAEASDGIIFPGGQDVEQVFYDTSVSIKLSDYYIRSTIEFSLIDQFSSQRKQIMGVCRGAQISNVYFGGTLQDVGWQTGIKDFSMKEGDTPIHQVFREIIGDKVTGISAHHMAADKIGKGLQVIYRDEHIPKLIVSEDGAVVLSQFHPESYIEFESGDVKKQLLHIREKILAGSEKKQTLIRSLKTLDQFIERIDQIKENKKVYAYFFDRIRSLKTLQTV